MTVRVADVRASEQPAVDLTAYPIRRANDAPEIDATVTSASATVPSGPAA